ncbi:hypothetical protein F5X96DRAFT_348013 [Biscogniauxia mediterranea]|nr:hypothetical protein F5X96DRAFT_348013 [Biscogniauxia mediterranea]
MSIIFLTAWVRIVACPIGSTPSTRVIFCSLLSVETLVGADLHRTDCIVSFAVVCSPFFSSVPSWELMVAWVLIVILLLQKVLLLYQYMPPRKGVKFDRQPGSSSIFFFLCQRHSAQQAN